MSKLHYCETILLEMEKQSRLKLGMATDLIIDIKSEARFYKLPVTKAAVTAI